MNNLARPTLGFDSKRDAIRHLHERGLPLSAIAHEVGSSRQSVASTMSKLKLRGNRDATVRPAGANPPLFLELSADLLKLLRPHAARRGLSCAALAAQIVDTVVMDGLVDGVLDDGSDAPC